MRRLSCSRFEAIGILESLWHWTARFAPRGDIGRWSNEEIAAGLGWTGEPGVLVGALVTARWLDPDLEFRLTVHDWAQHADDATKKALLRAKLDFVRTTADNGGRCPTAIDKDGGQNPPAVALPCLAVPCPALPLPPAATAVETSAADALDGGEAIPVHRPPGLDIAAALAGPSDSAPEPLPMAPDDRQAYADAVMDAWREKRGGGGPLVASNGETALIHWLLGNGSRPVIPLRVVLRAIEDLDRKNLGPKTPLTYADRPIREAALKWARRTM